MILKDFNDVIYKTNLSGFVHTKDIANGKKYTQDHIYMSEEKRYNDYTNSKYYHFEVDDLVKNTYYDVSIFMANYQIVKRVSCDCRNYRNTQSCEHIAAVFINYYKQFFNAVEIDYGKISDSIISGFLAQSNKIKKELLVSLNINVETYDSYYSSYKKIIPKVMVGEKKLYMLGNHLSSFMYAYHNKNGEEYFGKSFTYKPEDYYTTTESDEILEAYYELADGYNRYYSDSEIKKFLYKIRNCSFVYNNYKIDKIEEGFMINTNLLKSNDMYELTFDLENIEPIIEDDYEYILYKGRMYRLNIKEQKLLETLFKNEMDKLIIKPDKFNDFTKGLLGVIKKNLNVDASVDDIIIPKDIGVELYFDLRNNYILVNPKFKYDEEVVEYFKEAKVLRDHDFEASVINDLVSFGFSLENKKISMVDLESQVEFLEQGLEKLAEKYVVYTTEKFKNVNIKKKMSISSMFGIGQDNILSYNFDLGDIKSDELVNIFKEMKNKSKYYRLKNGDILNLEDESLKELNELSEDLELTDEEIRNGRGSVLKYRAIYLDSLKNNKYNIIKTDNLFDELLDRFYKYKNANLTLSDDELKILRDYQVTGVKWLYNLALTGFGGILADEMGLGKTIQVIYYIKQMLKDDDTRKFLIVVPTSLAYNWDHEFSTYANGLNWLICVGTKEKRLNMLKNNDASIYVTTYGLLREDKEIYQSINFHTMIIDEAQNIKNNMAGITKCVKDIKAETKFALTGTPIENNIFELWSIFDFIMPGYLATLTRFQSKYKIKDFDEKSEELIKGLSRVINPFILRRKKVDVIKELPDKLVNDIYIDLGDEQKKLYVAELERVKKEMEEIMNNDGISKARFLVLQLLTKLRQICIDPHIIYENYNEESNKIEQLLSIVNEYINNNHKILIFSSFKIGLNIVKEKLNSNGIKTYMIDGSVASKNRMKMVDDFNDTDEIKVFLIMLKSGGTGLNLVGADVVIHLDLWWNPQAENQATDRAHRIGQKNTVEVIHLITKGTIEEKILELQNKKKILSDKLIDGEVRDKNVLAELSKEDIENLLSYENRD